MICDHPDYDQYFEKCPDCGIGGRELHEEQCVPAGDFEIDENEGYCTKCGTNLRD